MKICISDVDGTILNSYGELSEETISVLRKFQENGNILVLASGRSYLRMMPVAKKLQMDKFNGYLIDVNGISLYSFKEDNRERFYDIEINTLNELFNYFKKFNSEIKFYCDDAIYTWLPDELYELKKKIRKEMRLPEDYPWTCGEYSILADTRVGYPYQKLIKDISDIKHTVNKLSICNEYENLYKIKNKFNISNLKNDFNIVFSCQTQIDVVPNGISKGIAVKYLINKLDIDYNNIYIFGDSENDLSMLSLSKNSFLMGNANNNLQILNYNLIKSNDDNGVSNIIKNII